LFVHAARACVRKLFTVKDLSEKIEPLLAETARIGQDVGGPRGIMGVPKQVPEGILFCKSTIDVSLARV